MIHRVVGKFLNDSENVRNQLADTTPSPGLYFERAPSGVEGKHIIVSNISGQAFNHLTNEASVGNAILQINCYGKHTTQAEQLYQAVRNRISGYQGEVTFLTDDGTEDTVKIAVVMMRPGMEINDPEDASDEWSYGMSADFSVIYEQTAPTHL